MLVCKDPMSRTLCICIASADTCKMSLPPGDKSLPACIHPSQCMKVSRHW